MHIQVILAIGNGRIHSKLFTILLQRGGYSVVTAEDTQRVYAALTTCHPALILLNIQFCETEMPTLIQHLKDNPETSSIPRIGTTVYTEHWNEEKALEAGYHGLITLPLDARPILVYIETFLTGHGNDT